MRVFAVSVICLRLALVVAHVLATSAARADELAMSRAENRTGDLDVLVARRTLRLLLPYSKTLFFIDRGQEFGLLAEVDANWSNGSTNATGTARSAFALS